MSSDIVAVIRGGYHEGRVITLPDRLPRLSLPSEGGGVIFDYRPSIRPNGQWHTEFHLGRGVFQVYEPVPSQT